MDKRRKPALNEDSSQKLETLYKNIASADASLGKAVLAMQKTSGLTQPEFAQHRGISYQALRQIISESGNPTVETLNKIASIYGLEVGFVPKRRGKK